MKKVPKHYWNYRVVKRNNQFSIYEVYYENNKPFACTNEPIITIDYDSVEEAKDDLENMIFAFEEDVLSYEDFENSKIKINKL